MWTLKVGQGGGPWLHSLNGFNGRETWEYDEQGGELADRLAVDKARAEFTEHRFEQRHSADLLMRMQVNVISHLCNVNVYAKKKKKQKAIF